MDQAASYVTKAYVSSSLSREASDHDVEMYLARRTGARRMSGVVGDLFAQSTWRTHALASLAERGMIQDDPNGYHALSIRYGATELLSRAVEHASEAGLKPYGTLNLKPQQAQTYEAVERRQRARARERHNVGQKQAVRSRVQYQMARELSEPRLPGFTAPMAMPAALSGAGSSSADAARSPGLQIGDKQRV